MPDCSLIPRYVLPSVVIQKLAHFKMKRLPYLQRSKAVSEKSPRQGFYSLISATRMDWHLSRAEKAA